ncbi:MAG: MBL fold metallo-hydrolase [Clostridiales bacterium]|nr:MBL fold metallo-hydrolase [Clostridiales bacterium]
MGYAKEKRKREDKKRKIKIVLFGILIILVVAFAVVACIIPPSEWKYRLKQPDISKRGDGELRVHFVDVGQGDATVVELPDGKVILIDGGNGSDEANKSLIRYLNALDVDFIDYLVVTHADADHCGGLTEVLKYKEIGYAYLPLVVEETDSAYAAFYSELVKEGCSYATAQPPTQDKKETRLSVIDGEYPYTLVFLYPDSALIDGIQPLPDDDNAASVVLWLDYMGTSLLFTGDATLETETRLLMNDLGGVHELYDVDIKSTEILKVAHHGSDSSTGEEFLQYLGNLQTAVVSCGEDNPYNHPSIAVCERLETAGATLYRTDLDGHIVITADKGGTYSVEIID